MKKMVVLVCVLALTGLAVPQVASAAGASACFTWNCSNGSCQFNGTCSTGTPYVWKYKWDYGDGSSSGLTGNATPTHGYSVCYPSVSLTVYDFDGNIESVSCLIGTGDPGCPGPPLPTVGTCQ